MFGEGRSSADINGVALVPVGDFSPVCALACGVFAPQIAPFFTGSCTYIFEVGLQC